MSCKLRKNTWGPNSPLFLLYFKNCLMITNVWFCYFLSLLRLMGISRVRVPVRVLEKFFFFFFFLSFLFFIFFSRGLFSSGAPGHCSPMPPSRYATALSRYQWNTSLLGQQVSLVSVNSVTNQFWISAAYQFGSDQIIIVTRHFDG